MYKIFMLCLALFLSACGNSLSVGDKVIVAPDYDEFRSGYIIGKVVSLRDDNVTVDIKKFKDIDSKEYFDGLEKGDEEDFSSEKVFPYDEGRVIVAARKKFFKEIAKLDDVMSNVVLIQHHDLMDAFMDASMAQVIGIKSMKKTQKRVVKTQLKALGKALKKIRLTADKRALLKQYAEEGRLKEWVVVLDFLDILSKYKESIEGLSKKDLAKLVENGGVPIAPFSEFEEKLNELKPVYQSMAYIGNVGGSSDLNKFIERVVNSIPLSIYKHSILLASIDTRAPKSMDLNNRIEGFAKLLNEADNTSKSALSLKLKRLQIFNSYDDSFDDSIEELQDKLDELPEVMLKVRNDMALFILHEKLSSLNIYNKSVDELVADLQQDLEVLGVTEESLEIDLNELLDQGVSAAKVARDLKERSWTGSWDMKSYRGSTKKKVKISKVKYSPSVDSKLQEIRFSGFGKLIMQDKDGSNLQDFNMTFTTSSSDSFQLNGGFAGPSSVKCGFMDEQEIQCSSNDGKSFLSLMTKDRKKEIKQEQKQAKKEAREALKREKTSKKHGQKALLKHEGTLTIAKASTTAPAKKLAAPRTGKDIGSSWNPKPESSKAEPKAHSVKSVQHRVAQASKKHVRGVSSADARILEKSIRTLTAML